MTLKDWSPSLTVTGSGDILAAMKSVHCKRFHEQLPNDVVRIDRNALILDVADLPGDNRDSHHVRFRGRLPSQCQAAGT
jgi:hypothetical protein